MFSTKMKTKILIILYFALSPRTVNAEAEQEVKRGMFPFMAFIYYPDDILSRVEGTGGRFLRGAVLIRPDWLVTSAVGVITGHDGFPQNTLLARAGAITIDSNFTLNEDEDEQEREIIQIVRPYNHSATQWWHTDISLMRTLLPFNTTSAVSPLPPALGIKQDYTDKNCLILVYAKRETNTSGERTLTQLSVNLLPPTMQNCGHHFVEKTMMCAIDSEDKSNALSPQYCQGNSGGPLVCEGDVIGIQTYIDNDCNQPHLYQSMSAWENFITCGIEDRCHEEQCSQACAVTYKDPQPVHFTNIVPVVSTTADSTEGSDEVTGDTEGDEPPTTVTSDDQLTTEEKPPEQVRRFPNEEKPEEERREETSETTVQTTTAAPTTTTTYSSTPSTIADTYAAEETSDVSWPKESNVMIVEKANFAIADRKPTLEAQHQKVEKEEKRKRAIGSAHKSYVLNNNLIFGYFILASLI